MGASEFFCLVAACVLWSAPLPRHVYFVRDSDGHDVERPLDVGVILPARARRGKGVRGRSVIERVARIEVEPVTGHRVTSPATTWAMMGAVLDVQNLVALGDHFVREPMRAADPPALTSIERLSAAMDAGRRRGINNLREALPQVRTRSRSRQETRTRLALIGAGLPEPVLNHPVHIGTTVVALIDVAYPRLLLGFEYEGEHHLTDSDQWAKDIRRYEMLADLGWRIIRVTKSDLGSSRSRFLSRARAVHSSRL